MGPKPQPCPAAPDAVKQFLLVGTPVWQISGIAEHPVSTHSIIRATISKMAVVCGSLLRRMILVYSLSSVNH